MAKKSKSSITKHQEHMSDAAPEKGSQDIFEERCKLFMSQLSTACEKENVKIAFAIVVDPETGEENPLIYSHGHVYEQAKILASVLREMKQAMNTDLSV